MDNKTIAICVIALVAIVGVALAVGLSGNEGGDGPEKVRQDYHLELTEYADGYGLEITLTGQSWGVVELYLGDDPLLDGKGNPIYREWSEGERVRIGYGLYYPDGYDFERIQSDLRLEFSVNIEPNPI
jgi:hypothetical protein